jgi:hypothetical protein
MTLFQLIACLPGTKGRNYDTRVQAGHIFPKPGVRGSIPFRDANLQTISDAQTWTGVNSGATGRRIHALGKGLKSEERTPWLPRGYTITRLPELLKATNIRARRRYLGTETISAYTSREN